LKRSTARSLGTLPKLCNPSEIATVHRDHLSLLDNNFLPLLENISGEQFFHRVVQHCSSNKGKNCIIVSRPFKSTTVKVDGAPLVVRQVSVTFIHFVLVLQRSYTFFFPLLSLVHLLLDQCWEIGLGLIGCIHSLKVQCFNAVQNFILAQTTSPVTFTN